MRALRLPLLLLALSAPAVAWPTTGSAEIYEYVDADGVSHFTNVPQHKARATGGCSSRAACRARSRRPAPCATARPIATCATTLHLAEAARLYQLPVAFLRAVMHVESDYDPNVVSVDGAMGLMQLMPFTAQKMGVLDPFDPRQNILGGARFLRILANQWNGDLVLTVASYNAGAGAVERYNGVPPYSETRRYVNRVLTRYYAYRQGRSADEM